MDEFMNPNGTDIVAVPYDAINKVPETTFRQLERFRWWGTQSYGPRCARLITETRKRNGKELRAHFNKKFVGDRGQLVDITEDFKLKRCQEIGRIHAETSSIREISDGNRLPNKYLEYTNNGGVFNGNPYASGAFAEQAESRDMNRRGMEQLIRRPVGREVMNRVIPRLLVGKRPPPPTLETYIHVAPLELEELPCHWRDNYPGLDAPYATGTLVLPDAEVPVVPLAALSLGAPPQAPAHDWDGVFNDLSTMEQFDPTTVMMFLQMDFHSRFKVSRKELFHVLLFRVNFDVMRDLFILHPTDLQHRLEDLLSPDDQALVFA